MATAPRLGMTRPQEIRRSGKHLAAQFALLLSLKRTKDPWARHLFMMLSVTESKTMMKGRHFEFLNYLGRRR